MAGSARAAERIGDQLAAYVELVDAAFNKLALPGRTQTYVQVRGRLCVCLRAAGLVGGAGKRVGCCWPLLVVAAGFVQSLTPTTRETKRKQKRRRCFDCMH
jgi:hypothetical protein